MEPLYSFNTYKMLTVQRDDMSNSEEEFPNVSDEKYNTKAGGSRKIEDSEGCVEEGDVHCELIKNGSRKSSSCGEDIVEERKPSNGFTIKNILGEKSDDFESDRSAMENNDDFKNLAMRNARHAYGEQMAAAILLSRYGKRNEGEIRSKYGVLKTQPRMWPISYPPIHPFNTVPYFTRTPDLGEAANNRSPSSPGRTPEPTSQQHSPSFGSLDPLSRSCHSSEDLDKPANNKNFEDNNETWPPLIQNLYGCSMSYMGNSSDRLSSMKVLG